MTKEEKYNVEQYGTAYPCCGNCLNIREAGFKLMCKLYFSYRDYDSCKCIDYKYQKHIDKLEELL